MERALYEKGDFIKRVNNYPGEHENMIMFVNQEKEQYEVAWMRGQHSPNPDFENLEILDFEIAHEFFKKVSA